jgi:hypothetical protein
MRQILAVFSLALLSAGCSADAPTAVAVPQKPNLGIYDGSRPVPVLSSAVNVGAISTGLAMIRVSFADTAEGEQLTSAYCTGATTAPATQNIGGTPEASGERVVDVALPSGCTKLMLRNRWFEGGVVVWGPFSAEVAITADGAVTLTKKKGHGK